jgi:galactose mutarotase-like enzyme
MPKDSFPLRNDTMTATVAAEGARLCTLKNAQGLDLLWQAGAAWLRHAPLLFPIAGRLENDELRHGGKSIR